MSEQPPSNTPGEEYFAPGTYLPLPHRASGTPPGQAWNKMAVWGFVAACISLFIFGFLGLLGIFFSLRGLREIRASGARGRGLAIAGAIIGAASFIFYLTTLFARNG